MKRTIALLIVLFAIPCAAQKPTIDDFCERDADCIVLNHYQYAHDMAYCADHSESFWRSRSGGTLPYPGIDGVCAYTFRSTAALLRSTAAEILYFSSGQDPTRRLTLITKEQASQWAERLVYDAEWYQQQSDKFFEAALRERAERLKKER